MSHRKPDREDLLTERRAKVIELKRQGLPMTRIAIELGTSYHCVFRDVKAVRRFQTSTIGTAIDDAVAERKPCGKPQNVKARAKRRYFCLNCSSQSWEGSGSWKPAQLHAQNEHHDVAQGTSEQFIIRHACRPAKVSGGIVQ